MDAKEYLERIKSAKESNQTHLKTQKRLFVGHSINKDIEKIKETLENIEILKNANRELNDLINTQSYIVSQERLNSINPELCIWHEKNGGICLSDDKYRCNECSDYKVEEGADT
jgi:neutral trehalase